MPQKSGSCLCGSVSFMTTTTNRDIGLCHCSMCRRSGSGPMMALDCGSEVSFKGDQHIGLYSSSNYGERGFCKNCGSSLFWKMKGQKHYAMSAGLFDDVSDFKMKSQIFIDDKPRFYEFANKTENMTGAEVMAKFAGS